METCERLYQICRSLLTGQYLDLLGHVSTVQRACACTYPSKPTARTALELHSCCAEECNGSEVNIECLHSQVLEIPCLGNMQAFNALGPHRVSPESTYSRSVTTNFCEQHSSRPRHFEINFLNDVLERSFHLVTHPEYITTSSHNYKIRRFDIKRCCGQDA